MSLPLMFFAFFVIIMVYSIYSSKKLSRQLFITMRTAVDRKEEFLVNIQSRYFYFRGEKYEIIPSCCKPMTWKRGIHSFIPTTVQTADYTWSDTLPIDPDTGKIFIVSPEARGNMDNEELFTSMNKSTKKVEGKKESGMGKYLPYVAIVLVLIVGGYLYIQQKSLNESITVLGQFFKDYIAKHP